VWAEVKGRILGQIGLDDGNNMMNERPKRYDRRGETKGRWGFYIAF